MARARHMGQYDDSQKPFSSPAGRPEAGSPWGETAPARVRGEQGGLQLPGESESTAWGSDGLQRPSPLARRRNQWRQHQQLTPDFGSTPVEPEPTVPSPPRNPNASLPSFKRGPAPQRPAPQRPAPPLAAPPRVERPAAGPPPRPRAPQPGPAPLQMHPHSIQGQGIPGQVLPASTAAALGTSAMGTAGLPPNVTPLRSRPRQRSKDRSGEALGMPPAPPIDGARPGQPLDPMAPARRSRAATARRRLANPPLPLLYLIRLIILGVGVAAIAGTLLSVLSPSNVASSRDGAASAARETPTPRGGGALTHGSATTVNDLRLTSEMSRLTGELGELATLTPGLTPVAFAVDLDSGQYVDLNGAEPVAAASTIKVPILVAFLQQVDAGTMSLNQSLTLQEEYMAGGSGTLRGEPVGTEYTALEIATRMIVVSDNTATNMMIAALGGIEALNQTFADWGLEHTLLRNPLPDLEGTNTTSAKDLALIMALIDQGGLVTARSRDRLFSIMQRTQNDSLIPSGIRDQSLTANKTGDIGSLLGDMAVVDVPNGRRYSLAVLVQRPTNDGRASELIRRMTETIHQELAQPVAPVGNPNANPVQLSPPGEFEAPGEFEGAAPGGGESPVQPQPGTMTSPGRVPARDEIPPG
ncbi:serine hydrolase [Nodosilinea sp. E11]|uniref:serine hydrolase n=1 Tax=Nodosilinea sp. E11 TaxID=3037479 RepID=UPI0029352A26|nr:serine hydrolase [Nodosilinea sp. E11]WOD40169.1 serine hydrolase [Nodosilinea sp. E11]